MRRCTEATFRIVFNSLPQWEPVRGSLNGPRAACARLRLGSTLRISSFAGQSRMRLEALGRLRQSPSPSTSAARTAS
jgi:hypothetical protein